MKVIRHAVAGLVFFALFMLIFVGIYNSTSDTYGFEDDVWTKEATINNVTTNQTIADQLSRLQLQKGVDRIHDSLNDINPPTGSEYDIQSGISLGVLDVLKIGTGLIGGAGQVVLGVATAPFEIVNIINVYYGNYLPEYIGTYLALIVLVYVVFIILSRYLKDDI